MTNEYPTNFEKLKRDFTYKKPTVLFLGSGINFNKKDNLSWAALLDHLLSFAFDMIPQLQNNTEEIKRIKAALCENDKVENDDKKGDNIKKAADSMFPRDIKSTIVKQFLGDAFYGRLIRDFLYKKISRSDLESFGKEYVEYKFNKNTSEGTKPKSFYSLFVIADMILTYPHIKAVVTYNYDQFLEDALDYLSKIYRNKRIKRTDRKHHTISNWEYSNIGHENNNDINIYHVHGFIPRYDEIQSPQNAKIILSLDEYYEDTKNVYSWQVASQLHFLSQYTCWFCGLSMDDITTQRLLHYVYGKHREQLYYITATENKEDTTMHILEKIKNKYREKNGLTIIYDEKGFDNIYPLLGGL